MKRYHLIKFECKKISSSVDLVAIIIFNYISPYCDLDLKIANQFFRTALWPMMMHHHTKFGYIRFSSWEDIIHMNIHWNFEPLLWPWPWTRQNTLSFSQTTQLMVAVGSKRINVSDDTVENHNLTIWNLHCDLDLEDCKMVFSPQLMMMQHYAKSGNKKGQ